MRCSRRRLIALARLGRVSALCCAAIVLCLVAGCAPRPPSPPPATFVPFSQPSAPSGAAATLTRALVAGHWEITAFEQTGTIMDTCLGDDASIDFALDGSWLAHNRQDGHTYGGAYSFSGKDGLALTAGQYQQYTVSINGDAMTLLGGRSLQITLRRGAVPATPATLGAVVPVAQ
jgi:hypothetical protein